MRIYILAFSLSLFLLSCQSPKKSISNLSENEKLILSERQASNQAIRSGELEKISSFWIEEIMISTGSGTLLSSKERVKEYLAEVFQKTPDIVFERNPSEIEENEGSRMAWESGDWKGFLKSEPDKIIASGKYAAAWSKEGDNWKIKSQLFVGL